MLGHLDLAEPLVHLFGQFVGLGIFGFEPAERLTQRLAARALLVGQIDTACRRAAAAMRIAIGKSAAISIHF